jgi:hypothetical protein
MTGFRVALGGARSSTAHPDLTTLGKIVGGGLPVGAFGGKRVIMDLLAPLGPVYQAGTLSGNPLAMAAGIATVGYLQEHAAEVYPHLEAMSKAVAEGVAAEAAQAGVPLTLNRVGSMWTWFFTGGPVTTITTRPRSAFLRHRRLSAASTAPCSNGPPESGCRRRSLKPAFPAAPPTAANRPSREVGRHHRRWSQLQSETRSANQRPGAAVQQGTEGSAGPAESASAAGAQDVAAVKRNVAQARRIDLPQRPVHDSACCIISCASSSAKDSLSDSRMNSFSPGILLRRFCALKNADLIRESRGSPSRR